MIAFKSISHQNVINSIAEILLLKLLMHWESSSGIEEGLPFGQFVQSEAFNLERSLSFTQNLEKLSTLTSILHNLRTILTDATLPQSQRIREALKLIQEEFLQESLPFVEEHKTENGAEQHKCQEVFQCEPTIKIDISSQDDMQSSGEREKTNHKQAYKMQNPNHISTIDAAQLQDLLSNYEKQLLRLKKEKEEIEVQQKKHIAQLTRKLQVSQEKNAVCCCKLAKGQEIGKMNKWLETLNKLLQGAQRQAAMSREELRRNGELTAKQLKDKDEQIKQLQAELQAHRSSPDLPLTS